MQAARENLALGLEAVKALLWQFSDDARLQFLHGSLLASLGRREEAKAVMARAVELDPTHEAARFHFGFFLATCGDPEGARRIWAPFFALEPSHVLRLLAEGLDLLASGRSDEAIERLERGVAGIWMFPELSREIERILVNIRGGAETSVPQPEAAKPSTELSAAHLLLQRYASDQRH